MLENEYPIPSYMADVFQRPEGWIETPEERKPSLLDDPAKAPKRVVYCIDCEMVCSYATQRVLEPTFCSV
jgi:RNA exonuclease 1